MKRRGKSPRKIIGKFQTRVEEGFISISAVEVMGVMERISGIGFAKSQ